MIIKINKNELMSLLGTEKVALKEFTGISWNEGGMTLKVSRTIFLQSLKVTIKWPKELAKFQTNRATLAKALEHLFMQVDERYEKAVAAKRSANAPIPGFVPDPSKA